MKEYLVKDPQTGKYWATTDKDERYIVCEIPEGAEICTTDRLFYFWKKTDDLYYWDKYTQEWTNNFGQTLDEYLKGDNELILWQRQPTVTLVEYLNPADWSLHVVDVDSEAAGADWIKVPAGAEVFANTKNGLIFYKRNVTGSFLFHFTDDEEWAGTHTNPYDEVGGFVNYIVWKRHTQPEELPFIDDESVIVGELVYSSVGVDEQKDNVNHPEHYTSDPSGVECIQITRHRNFNIGNAIKYLWRNGLKDSDSQIQDLQKAIWYINDEIERLEIMTGHDKEEV